MNVCASIREADHHVTEERRTTRPGPAPGNGRHPATARRTARRGRHRPCVPDVGAGAGGPWLPRAPLAIRAGPLRAPDRAVPPPPSVRRHPGRTRSRLLVQGRGPDRRRPRTAHPDARPRVRQGPGYLPRDRDSHGRRHRRRTAARHRRRRPGPGQRRGDAHGRLLARVRRGEQRGRRPPRYVAGFTGAGPHGRCTGDRPRCRHRVRRLTAPRGHHRRRNDPRRTHRHVPPRTTPPAHDNTGRRRVSRWTSRCRACARSTCPVSDHAPTSKERPG